ncbi:hypothetical protein F5Y08DRAFT_104639 [Xylaria arbuscula]|nr:hypothetical protein F5Y08DRAFT_104639 [Xylaria arbuscula]
MYKAAICNRPHPASKGYQLIHDRGFSSAHRDIDFELLLLLLLLLLSLFSNHLKTDTWHLSFLHIIPGTSRRAAFHLVIALLNWEYPGRDKSSGSTRRQQSGYRAVIRGFGNTWDPEFLASRYPGHPAPDTGPLGLVPYPIEVGFALDGIGICHMLFEIPSRRVQSNT